MTPCSLMESASSRKASREKAFRGWNGQGWMRANGTRRTCSLEVEATAVVVVVFEAGAGGGVFAKGLPPKSAPRPLPKAGFAMRPECRRAGELSIHSRGTLVAAFFFSREARFV